MNASGRISTILVIFTLLSHNTGEAAAGRVRLVRTADHVLRDRLAAAHLLRGEPVAVRAILPTDGTATPGDDYHNGMALAETGRLTAAAQAFYRAASRSQPGTRTWTEAVEQFTRLSENDPDLDLTPPESGWITSLDPGAALSLAGYLAEKGNRTRALALLEAGSFGDARQRAISAVLAAGHLGARGDWEESAKTVGRVRISESSAVADLLNLTRGYHYLQAGQPDLARKAFTVIPPKSPYAPEALLGKAWSMIRSGDIQSATIVLEELVDLHGHTRAAEDGVLDLAISFRELGLYRRAGAVLDKHLGGLREARNWLRELKSRDLRGGSDIATLLENALDGNVPDRDMLLRTPAFAREWIMDISSDPYVKHTSALLRGIGIYREKAAGLVKRLDLDMALTLREMDRVKKEISLARGTGEKLEQLRDRLLSLRGEVARSLQDRSLEGFASDRARLLISRAGELKTRLSLMESSVSKAEGFSSLIGRLSESVTASSEEGQLNLIRIKAYDGLISSRLTLRDLRNTLTALEGQLWLGVKGGAVDLERRTSLRVTSGRTRAEQAMAETSRAIRILTDRQRALRELTEQIRMGTDQLRETIPGRLNRLRDRVDMGRTARMLELAGVSADRIREAEARTLYTRADIEISQMENTVRSLQEAVQ